MGRIVFAKATGSGKQVGSAINKVAEFAKNISGTMDNKAGDVATQLISDVAGKAVDKQLGDKRQD